MQCGHRTHRKYLSGEFNDWDLTADVMERKDPVGIYTCFVEGAKENEMYKFCIETKKGELLYKADPYAIMQN